MGKKYKNEALMVCHQSAESLLRLGIIDAKEMREFDEGCLVGESETAPKIDEPAKFEQSPATI